MNSLLIYSSNVFGKSITRGLKRRKKIYLLSYKQFNLHWIKRDGATHLATPHSGDTAKRLCLRYLIAVSFYPCLALSRMEIQIARNLINVHQSKFLYIQFLCCISFFFFSTSKINTLIIILDFFKI